MSISYLNADKTILWKGVPYTLDRLIGDEWQILDQKTRKAKHIKVGDLLKKYGSGEIEFDATRPAYIPETILNEAGNKIAAHFDLYPEKDREQMKQRRYFLEAYLKRYGDRRAQHWLAKGIEELWDTDWGNAPHPATTARWLKRYISAGKDIRSLGTAHARKGNTKPRYPLVVTEKCNEAISRIHLRFERGSINATLDEAMKLVRAVNRELPEGYKVPMPSRSYIKSLIKLIPEYERHLKRFGKTAADHKFRKALHSTISDQPLQLVEIDHTKLDIFVVDGKTGLSLERPWLTLVIDVHTRAILGFCLGFVPPSHMTVAKALKMAVLPKGDIKLKWPSIRNEWPMFGCMENLRVDNGLEFHGESLEAACLQLGINIEFCPRKKSWWKGHIERAIGTLNRAVTDGLPGRTFASITEKSEYNPVKHAAIPLETMEEIIAKWIVDIYHYSVHSGTGLTPLQAWENGIQLEDIPMLSHIPDLDAVMGIIDSRKLSHRGIEINSLLYHSDELSAIRERLGNLKVSIRWNPESLGYIHVLPPDGSVLQVPVIPKYRDYADGLTLYQHTLCKEYAKNHLDGKSDPESLSIAKSELRELAENGMKDTKRRKRINQKRAQFNSPAIPPAKAEPIVHTPKAVMPSLATTVRPKFAASSTRRTNIKETA